MILPLLLVVQVFTGSTVGGPSVMSSPGCAYGTAPERSVLWTAAADGTARASTCDPGTRFDTILYIRAGSCAGPEVVCDDDEDRWGACPIVPAASTVQWPVTAGSVWCIVVDGYQGASGAYVLSVTGPDAPVAGCAAPPFYPRDFTGPPCSTARQSVECGCSECLTWDPVPGADEYRIRRGLPGTQTFAVVASTRYGAASTDEPRQEPVTSWCPAKVDVLPEGTLSEYRVEACRDVPGGVVCSAWSNPVNQAQAPYGTGRPRPSST